MNKVLLISLFCFLLASNIYAGHLDTVQVYSEKMDKHISVIVVLPEIKSNLADYPSVYLLHGHDGNHKNWSSKTNLIYLADTYEIFIICPDGSRNSWYLDSPIDPKSQYKTFVGQELVKFIDNNYPTEINKRAITGLSMGGHGALYLATNYPKTFIAAGSMSGGVDLTYSTKRWEIAQKLGSYEKFPERWHKNSIINMIPKLAKLNIALLIDCGVDDIFIGENRLLHQKLLEAKIDHDYIERPGKHSWDYWLRVLEYHLFFFSEQFKTDVH